MSHIFKMAVRGLLRNRRRTLLSMLALGMGLAVLLLMAATVTGEMRDAMNSTIKLQSGHLQVRKQNYNPDKASLKWEDLIENPNAAAAQVAALPPVKAATPRLFASGILTRADTTEGVGIVGIDPLSAASAPFRDDLISGQFLTADDSQGVLVGLNLANRLKLKAGDPIDLMINTSNGDVDQQNFTIRGIFNTKTPAFDRSTVLMPLLKAQAITRTQNHASSIFVLLQENEQTDAVAAALKSSQYEVKTYLQLNSLLDMFDKYANAMMMILYLIVLGITATVIINTLVMSVYERTREIGVLSAIGMKGGRIMLLFLIESSLLALGGIVMGLALGGLLCLYANQVGFYLGDYGATGMMLGERIYGYLTLKDTITLTILTLIVTLAGALYPAALAARLEPVEALHGGKLA
jgi:ABC-type lipoprotein release transport system permease subunit